MPVRCGFGANYVELRERVALSGFDYDSVYRVTIVVTDQESHDVLFSQPFVSIGSAHYVALISTFTGSHRHFMGHFPACS